MPRKIQLDLALIQNLQGEQCIVDRKEQIKQQKKVLHQCRNQLLAQHLSSLIHDESFDKTEHGKPYLKDHPSFYFNHSHSQKHYALATSASMCDLGVDIEDLDRKVRFDALAKHAFHPQEYQAWELSDFDASYWFKIWTTKEAVLKASGLGIRLSLNELNTHAHFEYDGGSCEHPLIGVFSYQNVNLGHAMLTVAWRSEHSCRGFAFPSIQLRWIDAYKMPMNKY